MSSIDHELKEITQRLEAGRIEEAETRLQNTQSEGSQRVDWCLLKGQCMLRQGRLPEAQEWIERALEVEPHQQEATFRLAFVCDLMGDDDRALSLYRECVDTPPVHVHALINLAVLHEDRGEYDQAEEYLQKVIEQYPNHARAQLFLEDVRSSLNMHYDEDQERLREKSSAVLDTPITDFELSVRSRNCLKKMNIFTLGDLLRSTEADLLAYKNFGETSLNEIKAMLRQKGLRLGQIAEEGQGNLAGGISAESQPHVDPALLNKSVSEMELSVRSRKCLQRLGVATIGELVAHTEAELLSIKNFGQTSLNEIKLRLADSGISLRKLDNRLLRKPEG